MGIKNLEKIFQSEVQMANLNSRLGGVKRSLCGNLSVANYDTSSGRATGLLTAL